MVERRGGILRFEVGPDDPRERADRLVTHLLIRSGRSTTRAEVQRWMAAGRVLIDGEKPRRARAVPVGAVVTVQPAPPPPSAATPDPTVPLRIVFEDEHLIVVDKPAGVVVHPARGHRHGTLVQGLLAHLQLGPEADGAGQAASAQPGRDDGERGLPADPRDPAGLQRPGIVHRLDKGTSGLLVVAKTAPVREALKQLFSAHDLVRRYTAIVIGKARTASYDTPHGRHPRSRLRFTTHLDAERPGARRAVTHVELVEMLPAVSVVRCRLETGRTHQIRVHLAECAKTPVLGDPLYGPSPTDPLVRQVAVELGRQALHAGLLGLVHPVSGETMRWSSPLPEDMQTALALLQQSPTRPST